MSGFLYKKLSEKEKEEINAEAKKIMDSFAKSLSKIKELPKEGSIEREESFRAEGEGKKPDPEFKKMVFENAPNKNKDFIIAEKKRW